MRDHMDDHDRGLAYDMATLVNRRGLLGLLGGAVLLGTVGCGTDGAGTAANGTAGTTGTAGGSGTAASTAAAGSEIPDETAGPYPGDGSNGPNVLTQSGIVRRDIRKSFGAASGVAVGVPLTIELTVTDDGTPYKGAAVYLWHADRDGKYSLYSEGITDQNYLRGVQEAGADGVVRFTSVFPAAYAGRWPHVHFEVYDSLQDATSAGRNVKTSQLAFPEDVCDTVYATTGYERSVANMTQLSLETDNVFSDGYASQLATVTGKVSSGYAARLAVAV